MIKLSEFLSLPEEPPKPPSVADLFEEEPVGLETFIKDKKFLGADWMLSPIQLELVKVIERVYLPDLYPLMAEEFGGYWLEQRPMKNLIVAQWGKGGGKDSTVRVASLRVAYMLMCLKSPQLYFRIPEDDSIHMLNIAANSSQAQRAFFEPMTKMVNRGWFRDRSHATRDTIQYNKNIEAISGHSDAETQEGLNLILGVADEIDAFKAKGEMVGQGNRARDASTSAESILDMLKTSASTRFPENFKRVAISFPRYLGSTIQQLTIEAKKAVEEDGDASSYYASGPYATWDVNPLRFREQFDEHYRKNPIESAAKYECKPSRAMDPYFRTPEIFKLATDSDDQPLHISYRLATNHSKVTGKSVTGWEPIFEFDEKFHPIQGARYAMHGDLALTGDRAGIALSHVERWEERTDTVIAEDGEILSETHVVPIVRNDFVIGFEADIGAEPAREIQIRWARLLCFELIKRGFYIGLFTFDGFQSAGTIQDLLSLGIESDRVSTDRTPDIWKTLKDLASESRLHMPYSQLLQEELEGLSRLDNGKVDHPPGGSKDLADAFACSLEGAILVGGEEDPEGSIVEIGASYFEVGPAVASLVGMEDFSDSISPVALPIGMKGLKQIHGRVRD